MSMTSTASAYNSSTRSSSESSFSSIEPSQTVFYHEKRDYTQHSTPIFDIYGELIQVLSVLLFQTPSRIETRVLFSGLQAWLKHHGNGLAFKIHNCHLRDIELRANYIQEPTSLVLLIDETQDREIPYGVILRAADETLICFYIVPERVKQIAMEQEQPGSYMAQLQENWGRWSEAEFRDTQSFGMWVRANMAFFAQI